MEDKEWGGKGRGEGGGRTQLASHESILEGIVNNISGRSLHCHDTDVHQGVGRGLKKI
jgi:hypothetical protein